MFEHCGWTDNDDHDVLNLGMQHKGLKFYKFYINNDSGLTLAYFTVISNKVAYTCE